MTVGESAATGAALGDYVFGIEHFGSTAVPGLIAKPIVDIPIGAQPGSGPHVAIDGLAGLGYEYLGEDGRRPGRIFWRKRGSSDFNVSAIPYLGVTGESDQNLCGARRSSSRVRLRFRSSGRLDERDARLGDCPGEHLRHRPM